MTDVEQHVLHHLTGMEMRGKVEKLRTRRPTPPATSCGLRRIWDVHAHSPGSVLTSGLRQPIHQINRSTAVWAP